MTGQKHEIFITRGESFSIDKIVLNQNGDPFIISNQLKNPYFLIKISQSKFAQQDNYYLNVWLKIPKTRCFYSTNCIKIQTFDVAPTSSPNSVDMGNHDDQSNYAVYYIVDDEGNKIYKTFQNILSTYEYVDYETRINYTFDSNITAQWKAQNYVYSIDLVDGVSTEEYITSLYRDNISSELSSLEEMYNELLSLDKCNNTDYMKNVDINKEII